MPERRYTAAEWQLIEGLSNCAAFGCSFDIVLADYDPVMIICTSCGRKGEVKMGPRKQMPEGILVDG